MGCVRSLSSTWKCFHGKEAPVHRRESASRGLWAQPLLRECVLTRVKTATEENRPPPNTPLWHITLNWLFLRNCVTGEVLTLLKETFHSEGKLHVCGRLLRSPETHQWERRGPKPSQDPHPVLSAFADRFPPQTPTPTPTFPMPLAGGGI